MKIKIKAKKEVIVLKGLIELYEHQEKAQRLLEADEPTDILVSSPTGSGKTWIGQRALVRFGKGAFVVPTVALGYEMRRTMQEAFPEQEVVLGNKDYALNGKDFRRSDIRILTYFKLRQMLMSVGKDFSRFCPEVVLDEIHNLDPDTELIVTALKLLHPSVHKTGLSATVHEDDEPKLTNWLGATLVKSDKRPVPVVEHIVHFDPDLTDDGREVTNVRIIEHGKVVDSFQVDHALGRYEHLAIVDQYIREKMDDTAPRMVYTPYRYPASKGAVHMADLRGEGDLYLQNIARDLPSEASEHSQFLKQTLGKRVGIHHGGLSPKERELVQDLAQNKPGEEVNLDILFTCETLAQGVNLPARHIIFDTIYQHSDNQERRLIDISKFRQIQGRAGRPQYDTIGHTWICVFSEIEKTEVEEVLLKHKASKIESRIYDQYFLEGMVPMLIYFGWNTPAKFVEFIKGTYWGMSLQDTQPLVDQFERIVEFLIEQEIAVLVGGKILVLTNKGVQCARLGLHPLEYARIEELTQAEELKYETWIGKLASVCFGYVTDGRQYDSEAKLELIMEVAAYGLTIFAAKGVKHDAKQLVDYVQRLLDITRSYFRFNDVNGYSEKWEENVYERFAYGTLIWARTLSDVLATSKVKRLVRNMGQVLAQETLDEAAVTDLIKHLWGHLSFISPRIESEIYRVANELKQDPDEFLNKVHEVRVNLANQTKEVQDES